MRGTILKNSGQNIGIRIQNRIRTKICGSESGNTGNEFGSTTLPITSLMILITYRHLLLIILLGCRGVGEWTGLATWFPGFVWRVCVCPQCGAHLGWMFEPEDLLASPAQDTPSPAGSLAGP
jgi:hypothetical protein